MTVSFTPAMLATSIQPATTSASGSNSIADIASEFSSLLANFSTPQPNVSNSAAPTPSPTSALPGSNQSSFAALLFVSQTTTTTTSAPAPTTSQPPLFASVDTSGNGLIDQQEFINKFGAGGNQGAASQLFGVLDRNHDNEIDGTELAPSPATSSASTTSTPSTATASTGSPMGFGPLAGAQPSVSNVDTAPQALSPDAGWSPGSLFQMLPGMQPQNIPGAPVLPLFTRLDANQDGILSQGEFGIAYGSNVTQANATFANLDTNQNGSLDWQELNAAQSAFASVPPAAAASAAASATTTTTTSFLAELIQLQQAAQSTPSSTPSASTGGSTTPAATPASSSTTGGSNSTGSATDPAAVASSTASTTPAATGSTTDPAAVASSTVTAAPAATGSTTPAATADTTTTTTDTLAAAIAQASDSAASSASQTASSLQAGLLDALNPGNNGSSSTATGAKTA